MDDYSTFFVDLYGVLFDGMTFSKQVLLTLKVLKQAGKKVVIVSNSAALASESYAGYVKGGLIPGVHYDEFVTSGEYLHYSLKNYSDKFSEAIGGPANTVKCVFMGNSGIFRETGIQSVSDTAEADFLYLGPPRSSYGTVYLDDVRDEKEKEVNLEDVLSKDWNSLKDRYGRTGLMEFAALLEKCLRLNKTLLILNPDIFASVTVDQFPNHARPIVTQGILGAYYEKLGGRVVRYGKPNVEIFEYAKQISDAVNPIIMVGDTPWTDVSGASACGIDAALVTSTGVSFTFLNKMDRSLSMNEKLNYLFNVIAPKMSKSLFNVRPRHFIEHFYRTNLPHTI
jgi:ribonucleotide monophosphatase NagD (HAD superfamily)